MNSTSAHSPIGPTPRLEVTEPDHVPVSYTISNIIPMPMNTEQPPVTLSNTARAAMLLLNSAMFCNPAQPRFHPDRVDFDWMLEQGHWSSGERILLEVAASLAGHTITAANGRAVPTTVDLGRLTQILSRENLQVVLQALLIAN